MTAQSRDIPAPLPDDLDVTLRRLLATVADVYELRRLSPEERAELRALEELAEEGGAAGGLMPFVNEGIWKALDSDQVYAVTTGPMTNEPPSPWTIMLDEDDRLVGEWLPASRIEEAKENRRCVFLSNDFVMYRSPRPRGKTRFVMPFICVPDVDAEPGVTVCGFGSPSTPADKYIRSLMGDPGVDVATLVLGVCFEQPSEERAADQG